MAAEFDDDTLRAVLGRLDASSLVRGDFAVGVLLGVAGGILAASEPDLLIAAASPTTGLAGVVIGSVLAAATLASAFMDPAFLRKLKAIDEDPLSYLAPFFLTGVLATTGALLALVLSASSVTAPGWWLIPLGAIAAFTTGWALAGMVPNLTNLIRFIRLQQDAADVDDPGPS